MMTHTIRVAVPDKPRVEFHNHHGIGNERTLVYSLVSRNPHNYWDSVTDIPCPRCKAGMLRWAEAGYVPGYRICDRCKRHFLAQGNSAMPDVHLIRK